MLRVVTGDDDTNFKKRLKLWL